MIIRTRLPLANEFNTFQVIFDVLEDGHFSNRDSLRKSVYDINRGNKWGTVDSPSAGIATEEMNCGEGRTLKLEKQIKGESRTNKYDPVMGETLLNKKIWAQLSFSKSFNCHA